MELSRLCEGGTAVDLVMATLRVDVGEAFEWLATRSPDSSVARERSSDSGWPPSRRDASPATARPVDLEPYVDQCFRLLQDSPKGRPVLDWLWHARGIPEEVLRHHHIGLDPGGARLDRPPGVPAAHGVVLPIRTGGRTVFTQTRGLNAGAGQAKYLSCSSEAATNPRFGRFDPPDTSATCVVVCEGAFDAMSANAAGLPAVAVLGTGVVDGSIAGVIGQRATTVLLALARDDAGERATDRLRSELDSQELRVRTVRFPAGTNDLNDWARSAGCDWPVEFGLACRDACLRAPAVATSLER